MPNSVGPDNKTFDGQAVLQAAGIRTFLANNAQGARQTLQDAISATCHGAVALLLPTDVQNSRIQSASPVPGPQARTSPPPRSAAVDLAVGALAQARRPLIIAGVGAHRSGAANAIVELAAKTGAMLATTLKAKDMFRGHPYNVGVIGSFSHAAGRHYMDQADCVIAIGAGLNMRTTSYGQAIPTGATVIQIDTDRSHVGRWNHADIALVADARETVEILVRTLPDRSDDEKPFHGAATRQRLADYSMAMDFEAKHTPRTVDPRSLALALDQLLPTQRNVVYDTGNFFQVGAFVSVPGPGHIKLSADFASIGVGFGTALGFSVGRADVPTVLFIGDGGLLMTLGELETVVREDIALVIVVMNDCAYGAERHYLQVKDMPVATSLHPDVDYAPIAEAFGITAATVRSMEQLHALAPMLRNPQGPMLLDCKINGAIPAPFLLEALQPVKAQA